MEQIGVITAKNETIATVQFKRATACGENCGMCGGCENLNAFVDAINVVDAEVGDTVKIETNTTFVLLGAFFVYIIPIVLGLVGYFAFGGIGAAILCFVPFIILKVVNSTLDKYYRPKVVKIVNKGQ